MKKLVLVLVVLCGLGYGQISPAADFNGDGTNDIGIFRPASGLWAIRGVTRAYFGGSNDDPMPGDYNGDGTVDIGLFRASSGLWAVRGVTRVYFGGSGDDPLVGVMAGGDGAGSFWSQTGSDIYYNAGNVGIGTNDPGTKLEVAGTVSYRMDSINIDSTSYTLNPQYSFYEIYSDNPPYDLSLSIGNGLTPGQLLIIAGVSGTDVIILSDSGNAKLAGEWAGWGHDNITLIWDGSYWIETSRSNN